MQLTGGSIRGVRACGQWLSRHPRPPPPHRALRPPTHAQPGLGTVAWAATAEASGGTRGSRLLSGLGLGLRGALADGVRPSRAAAGS